MFSRKAFLSLVLSILAISCSDHLLSRSELSERERDTRFDSRLFDHFPIEEVNSSEFPTYMDLDFSSELTDPTAGCNELYCPLNIDCARKPLLYKDFQIISEESFESLDYLWTECAITWKDLQSFDHKKKISKINALESILALYDLHKFCEESNFEPYEDIEPTDKYWRTLVCAYDLNVIPLSDYFHPEETISSKEIKKMILNSQLVYGDQNWEGEPQQDKKQINWEDLVNILANTSRCYQSDICLLDSPKVSVQCLQIPEQKSCSGQEDTIFQIFCELKNLGEDPLEIENLLVEFADHQDRETCGIYSFHHEPALKGATINPGETISATRIQILCFEAPHDQKVDLSFGILKMKDQEGLSWFYDADFESISLGKEQFNDCPDPYNIEGWECDPAEGYPLWISSVDASYTILKRDQEPVNQLLESNGVTIFFECTDLPAAILIEGVEELNALSYGHNLPEFSAWISYDGGISLFPEQMQSYNTNELSLDQSDEIVLIRIPALDEM